MERVRGRSSPTTRSAAAVGGSLLALAGCAPATPDPSVAERFAATAAVQQRDALTVRVRPLSAEESRAYFGASLARWRRRATGLGTGAERQR